MYRIAVIPGDGTGPEVVQQGIKVLKKVESAHSIRFDFKEFDFGGARYLSTGQTLSDDEVAARLQADGLDIARRTVTKYRKAMGIVSSRQRKTY